MTRARSGYAIPAILAIAGAIAAVGPAPAAAQSAEARYAAAQRREADARAALAATPAEAPLARRTKVLTEAREVMAAYEALVRRYWTSGYADNALYNAGRLAEALYDQYGLTSDLDAALRYYRWLRREYPTASLARTVDPAIARLERAAEARAPIPPPLPDTAGAGRISAVRRAASSADPDRPARITAIERTVLPDAVRVTISLDGPASFEQELIDGPARLFFDIKRAEAPPELVGAVLRYPANVVRQIRVGRHPDAIRVVLDFEEVARHSVYTLQDPFRIVVLAAGEASAVRTGNDAAPTPPGSAPPAATPEGSAAAAPAPPSDGVTPVRPALDSAALSSPADAGASESGAGARATGGEPAALPAARGADQSPSRSTPSTAVPAPPRGNSSGGFSIARQLGLGVSRIVIDPGHGGHDPGAQVGGLDEADLTLDIALRLEKLLQKEPGLEVVLTRRTDIYVPLEERTAIANREQADLFLSIHANTSRNRAARGVETYYLSFAGSPDAEEVAARENSVNPGEMHRLPDLIKAIALNNKLDESRDFAGMVQEALVSRLRRSSRSIPDRGVRKAPFVVLIGAEMPSVLAEVAFMSNRHDLALLKTDAFKQRIAEALHAGIMRYRRALKATTTVASQ